jgi:hypothetical protein
MRLMVPRSRMLPYVGVLAFLLAAVMLAPEGGADETGRPSLPPTNRQAAERAVAAALEQLGVPEGNGAEAACTIDGPASPGGALLDILAVEFLGRRGYKVRTGDGVPGFRFGLDSLTVDLDGRGVFRVRRVDRHAEATVTAEYRGSPDTRYIYRARGVFDDSFSAAAAGYTGRAEPFVNDRSGPSLPVEPILFGLAVTGLIWLLYSYRG